MSHQPERKDKNCLNCGTVVAGRYCQACGQENIVTHQSFWALTKHFVYDVLHFDGKLFETLKHLLVRPGLVPKEYVSGRRMKYLDPIRMYLFTSAVFFLVFFSLSKLPTDLDGDDERMMSPRERLTYAAQVHSKVKEGGDSMALRRQLHFLLDTNVLINLSKNGGRVDGDSSFSIHFNNESYVMSVEKRRSVDSSVNIRPEWLERKVRAHLKNYQQKYGDDDERAILAFIDIFFHNLPYALFASLPFFALILQLLYMRRKQFFYSDHAVFTLYQYIFTFILLLINLLLGEANERLDWALLGYLRTGLTIFGGIYLLFSMKRFYAQPWMRTLLKFVSLNLMALVMIAVLMGVFLLLSATQL